MAADFIDLNPDQRREAINTQQRYAGLMCGFLRCRPGIPI